MGANNWQVCPRCKQAAARKQEEQRAHARGQYGIATPEEYERLMSEASQEVEHAETLREDWGIGTSDKGTFSVSYHCSCQRCGFRHEFKHEQQLPVSAAKPQEAVQEPRTRKQRR